MTETPEQWMPATNEQAARLIDLIDELSACVRDGKSMGLGDVSIVNGIRAKFIEALLTEWCDGVKTEPVREDLLQRLEAQRLAVRASSLGEPVSQEAPWTYRPQDARYPFLNQIIVDGAGKDVTSVLCISTAEKIVNAANRASRSAFSGIPRTDSVEAKPQNPCVVFGCECSECSASVISSASPLSEDVLALMPYVKHHAYCRLSLDTVTPCSCGLSNILGVIGRLSASAPSPE